MQQRSSGLIIYAKWSRKAQYTMRVCCNLQARFGVSRRERWQRMTEATAAVCLLYVVNDRQHRFAFFLSYYRRWPNGRI